VDVKTIVSNSVRINEQPTTLRYIV